MKSTLSALLAALMLSFTVYPVHAAAKEMPGPSSSAIVFDVLFARPLGIVATAVGTAVFIVGLPFTIPARSVGVAAEKLIADPLKYTFTRPVGALDDDIYGCDPP